VAPVLIALRCSHRCCGLAVALVSPALRCAALSPKMQRLTWKFECLTWRILIIYKCPASVACGGVAATDATASAYKLG